MSLPVDDKPSLKRAWSALHDQLYNFTPHEIYLEQLKLDFKFCAWFGHER